MYAQKTTIINRTGLHARPANLFVVAAKNFKSDIQIHKFNEKGEKIKSCPAKSIVSVLTMQLTKGTRIEITAEGQDEKQAVDTLVTLVEGGFDDL